jgi:hypothetical protein
MAGAVWVIPVYATMRIRLRRDRNLSTNSRRHRVLTRVISTS